MVLIRRKAWPGSLRRHGPSSGRSMAPVLDSGVKRPEIATYQGVDQAPRRRAHRGDRHRLVRRAPVARGRDGAPGPQMAGADLSLQFRRSASPPKTGVSRRCNRPDGPGTDAARRALLDWLGTGGFPEAQGLDTPSRHQLLRNYVGVAMLRDVVERHDVRNVTSLRWLVRHLLGNAGGMFSIEKFHAALKSQGIPIAKGHLAISSSGTWKTASSCGSCGWNRPRSDSAWSIPARRIRSTRG